MAVVDVASIEQDVYSAIRTLLVANKPTYDRTISGTETTFTYTILSEYPEDNTKFPCIIIDESEVNINLINLDGSEKE